MAPRATWKGHVKFSLVSFAVRVHNATSSAHKVTLNQLHRDCNRRLKQKMVCPEHGDVGRDDIVKGYEFDKGTYVVVEPEDIEKIQLETTKTIDITQFVDRDELTPMYLNAPYYVAPDGPVAEEAFRVIREAVRKSGKVGIGRFVVAGREHVVSFEVEGDGFLMTTIRSDAEVRQPDEYFDEIHDGPIDKGHLQLAEDLIKGMTAPLDTSQFRDRYQDALLEVIKAKIDGKQPSVIQEQEPAQSLSFMDALKASIETAGVSKKPTAKTKKKPPARSVKKTASKDRKKA